MNKPKAKVKYLGLDVKASKTEKINKLKWYTLSVEKNFVKRYYTDLSLFSRLSPSARIVLDVCVILMDYENNISNSAITKRKINQHLEKHDKSFTDNTINKAFLELKKESLLISEDKRGMYKVNPVFFFKGNEKDRLKLIRIQAEKPIKEMAEKQRENYLKEKKQ